MLPLAKMNCDFVCTLAISKHSLMTPTGECIFPFLGDTPKTPSLFAGVRKIPYPLLLTIIQLFKYNNSN